MLSKCRRRQDCRLCGSQKLELVFALTPTPPANAFVSREQLSQQQEAYPLDVFFCQSCAHVQLLDVVDPGMLFSNYVYVSGTSPVFVDHFKQYAETVTSQFGEAKNQLVVDIGGNDGTLLKFFKAQGAQVLGIDPAQNIAERATQGGVETLPEFFTEELADKLASQRGAAKYIFANNVCAHIDNLADVMKGVKKFLAKDGVFVFEVSYLRDVVEKTLFDTIYHEHVDYHSLIPLGPFFERFGLTLFDAERVSSHGGSLRGYVCHDSAYKTSERILALVEEESKLGLNKAETFVKYAEKINALKSKFMNEIQRIKAAGKKIVVFGAPAKATTLMYHFQMTPDYVEYIVDDSPLKQGLFSPGFHIPVYPSSKIYETKPDYVVILAWNFADSVIAKHEAFLNAGGRFVVPLPEMRIV